MSTLLEQAIVDAEALKEAALKNAEQAIVEKYSAEVKTAVSKLLEQPMDLGADPAMDLGADPAMDLGVGEEEESLLVKRTPPAYEDDDVEISEMNFDLQELRAEMEKDKLEAEEMLSREEELSGAAPVEQEVSLALEGADHIEVDDETLEEILEAVRVDIDPQKSGWAGTPASQMAEYEDMLLAKEKDTEVAEKNAALRKAVKGLEEANRSLKKSNKRLKEKMIKVNDRLNDINVSNAKLLYTNRVLGGTSLNERQKKKFVEAISRAGSVEEAKVIYETLLDTVGSTSTKVPKSLSEAASRNRGPSMLLSRNGAEKQPVDHTTERWKRLAGIDTNN